MYFFKIWANLYLPYILKQLPQKHLLAFTKMFHYPPPPFPLVPLCMHAVLCESVCASVCVCVWVCACMRLYIIYIYIMHLHLYYKSCIPLTTYLYINSHSVFVCIRNQRSDFDAISSLLLPKEKFKINPIYIISTIYCRFISHLSQQQNSS